jgi:hypothetical protein
MSLYTMSCTVLNKGSCCEFPAMIRAESPYLPSRLELGSCLERGEGEHGSILHGQQHKLHVVTRIVNQK